MVLVIVLHFYDKASKALIIWLKVLQPKLMEPPKILNCCRKSFEFLCYIDF